MLFPSDLVAPFFVLEGAGKREAIATMSGLFRLSVDQIIEELKRLMDMGLKGAALFPVIDPKKKDRVGSEALKSDGLIPHAIQQIKTALPGLCLFADVALDPFTTHGHDGLVDERGYVLNDETVEALKKMSVVLAAAGVDYVAPSDMMDGRIGAIRHALDQEGYKNTGILAYSAKYASCLYSPFRDALRSTPSFGNKRGYQMDPANGREALLEAKLDEEEGADMLMVKPALFYLDVIYRLRQQTALPLCAYHVSGEYAMVMAAAEKGIVDAKAALLEALIAIKRAGADLIFSYATPMVLPYIQTTSKVGL